MKILIFEWGTYTHNDILFYFDKFGIKYDVVKKHSFVDINHDDAFKRDFSERLIRGRYDFVYSTNYFPLVAECCNEQGYKYISWSYDAPLNVPDIERTLVLPCNHAFMYDREQAEGYRKLGFDNVYHLPLAVNTKRLDDICVSAGDRIKYGAKISFVGNLYDSQFHNIRGILDEFHQGFIDALMKVQSKIYGYFLIDEMLTDGLMDDINRVVHDKSLEYRKQNNTVDNEDILHISREALSYAMAAEITREDRLLALKLLSNHYDVKLYSRERNELMDSHIYMGMVDYDTEMPKVFKCSDINLNMTLRCIRSGIPLRALDIMGAGGFLLSNYQPELAESFTDGEDLVMFDSIEDMYEKVNFYLKNDDIRKHIAVNGHNKVSDNFRYEDRIRFIFDTAGIE